MSRLDPYLIRLGLTAGQAWTLALGLVLGGVLLATSVPPVWDRVDEQQVRSPQSPLVQPTDRIPTPSRSTP